MYIKFLNTIFLAVTKLQSNEIIDKRNYTTDEFVFYADKAKEFRDV